MGSPANRFHPFVSVLVCSLGLYLLLEKTSGSSILNINKSFHHMNKVNLFYLGDKVMRPTIRYFSAKSICLLSTLKKRRGNTQLSSEQYVSDTFHTTFQIINMHSNIERAYNGILLNLQKRILFFFIFITP